jgi:hypothetical protein
LEFYIQACGQESQVLSSGESSWLSLSLLALVSHVIVEFKCTQRWLGCSKSRSLGHFLLAGWAFSCPSEMLGLKGCVWADEKLGELFNLAQILWVWGLSVVG